ncbi:hypothetical protein Hanom_Chr16g01419621 [Helianthus anomalus]
MHNAHPCCRVSMSFHKPLKPIELSKLRQFGLFGLSFMGGLTVLMVYGKQFKLEIGPLWVHFSSLCFISFTGIYLLHQEYKIVLVKRVQQLRNRRNQPSQLTVLVRQVPLCDEHKTFSCNVDHFFSKYHPHAYHSYQILYGENHLEVM